MEIVDLLVTGDMIQKKCPYTMKPKGICVHNTDNDAPARNEVLYMRRNSNSTSFHYAVDDKEIVRGIPDNRNAWHAGDGGTGDGNRNYISVEICYSQSGGDRFDKAEINASRLIAELMMKYGFSIENIKRHKDFSGKNCPSRTMKYGWNRFLDMVKREYALLKKSKEEDEEMRYLNLEDIPVYGKKTVEKLLAKGYIKGTGKGLDISEDMLRTLIILDRAGNFDK